MFTSRIPIGSLENVGLDDKGKGFNCAENHLCDFYLYVKLHAAFFHYRQSSVSSDMNGRTPQQLNSFLSKHFDLSELRQLAFDLGIDHEELEGKNKSDFIISLIQYVQRHKSLQELEIAAEKVQAERTTAERKVSMKERSFGTKIGIFSIVVTIVGIIVTLVSLIPGCQGGGGDSTPTPTDRILLQVRVQSSEDQTAVGNVKVSLEYSDALFPEERTDSLGRAVFNLPVKAVNERIKITVAYKEQVETQNITVSLDMPTVVFEIRP